MISAVIFFAFCLLFLRVLWLVGKRLYRGASFIYRQIDKRKGKA